MQRSQVRRCSVLLTFEKLMISAEFKAGHFQTRPRGALLCPILRRVRQRLLMFVNPNPIAHVDIAAAHRAFPEVLGLGQSRSGDLPTDDDAARARFVVAGDFHLMFRSKKSGRDCSQPDSYTARGVHPTALPS
jgi:hypothetical protein